LLLVQFVFLSYSQYSLLAFFPGHFRLEKNWDSVSAERFALVQKMLKVAPLERATIEDILEDLWMKDTTVVNIQQDEANCLCRFQGHR
jgi:hypothetical protein